MHAVAFAAGERADLLFLVGAAEVEAVDVGPGIHLFAAHFEVVVAAGDFLIHGLLGFERVAILVNVAQLDSGTDSQLAAVRLLLPDDHAEERRLASAVGADDAHDAAGGQTEVELVDEYAVAIALDQALGFNNQFAQVLARRNL